MFVSSSYSVVSSSSGPPACGLQPFVVTAPLAVPRGNVAVAELDGSLYAVGGGNGTTPEPAVEVMVMGAMDWGRVQDMPGSGGAKGMSVGGKLYVVSMAADEVYEYSPATGWTTQTGTTTPAPSCAVAVNGRGYVMGSPPIKPGYVRVLDPMAGSWSDGPSMPRARERMACAALGDRIYVVGGTVNMVPSTVVDVLDTLAGEWTTLASELPTPPVGAALIACGDSLHLLGGSQGPTPTNMHWVYDTLLDQWSAGTPLQQARVDFGVARLGADVWVVGGFTSTMPPAPTNMVERALCTCVPPP
jgi:hypothetical protein